MFKERSGEVLERAVVLRNQSAEAKIYPQGAFLSSLAIEDKHIIFPPTKEKPGRGGIRLLGPTPGPIKDTFWESLYPNMPSHGTDRKVSWSIQMMKPESILMQRSLGPAEFLFTGMVTIQHQLLKDGYVLQKTVENWEDKPRNIGTAFHPYFSLDERLKFSIDGLYPLKDGDARIVSPIPLFRVIGENGVYEVKSDPRPTQTVVWTDNANQYVCIEPWWAEIGNGDTIPPRGRKNYSMSIMRIA